MCSGPSCRWWARTTRSHRHRTSIVDHTLSCLQDIASKGLSLLYELGNDETKRILVDGLVGTLSDGKVAAQKFTQDSDDKVFEPGTLGTTKDGLGPSARICVQSLS